MHAQKNSFTFPDTQYTYTRRAHILHLIIMITAVTSISTAAIFYSLGYQVNFKAHSIQQTGLLTLDSKIDYNEVTISVNGKEVSHSFPYRSGVLFPDGYTIMVQKPGYQVWKRTIEIEPNRVDSYRTILLIKETPTVRVASSQEAEVLNTQSPDADGLEIKVNELWIKGRFITRTSDDIVSVTWFPDHNHVVYQSGKTLWICEVDGRGSQQLLTFDTVTPVRIGFLDNGKILVYQSDSGIFYAELF